MTARRLGIPSATTFDYEFAYAPASARLPRGDAGRRSGGDPARAARALRRRAAEARPVPGAEGGVLPRRLRARPGRARAVRASTRRGRSWSCARRRTSRSTTAARTRSSRRCSSTSATTSTCTRSSCRAQTSSATSCAGSALPSVLVPDRAVDGQSLIALADVVVSAGGTMNREAVALGVPVYTTYGGRLGGVDEMLIREGRLIPPQRPARPRPAQARGRARACPARSGRDARTAASAARAPRAARARSARASPGRRPEPRPARLIVLRPARRDLGQRRVVEDDVRGDFVAPRALQAPLLERDVGRVVRLLGPARRPRLLRPRRRARAGSGSACPTT